MVAQDAGIVVVELLAEKVVAEAVEHMVVAEVVEDMVAAQMAVVAQVEAE